MTYRLTKVFVGALLVAISVTSASAQPTATPTAIDFSGKWMNQRGSTMELKQDAQGNLTGDYTTIVGSTGNPFTKPLAGKARGDQLVFYVDWAPYSMATWAGQLVTERGGKEVLDTVWINNGPIDEANEPNDGWSAARVGGDRFTRTK